MFTLILKFVCASLEWFACGAFTVSAIRFDETYIGGRNEYKVYAVVYGVIAVLWTVILIIGGYSA